MSIAVLCRAGDLLGEGPLWDHRCGRLLWVDILRGLVHSWSAKEGARELLRIDGLIGAVALSGDSDLLLATTRGVMRWREPTHVPELVANPLATDDVRFNDGRVDRAGRFWIGTMAREAARYVEPLGVLYRVDPDGSAHAMERGLTISNGLDWSPDGKTLYLTDTMRRRIYAYDFDEAEGAIENRRVFTETDEGHGYPDGLCVDDDGGVWSACFAGGCLCRYDPAGRLAEHIVLPVSCPTALAFAPGAAATAFVTTSSYTLAQGHGEALAGSVLQLSVPRSGRAASVFGKGVAR